MRILHYIAVFFCCIFAGHTARAEGVRIEEFSLANGLQVIVIPNHRVPAVSQMIWFPTGGADDPIGKSGLTHFHEHTMFKGTRAYPAGEFEAIISKLGGEQNAFTSYDTTAYYINIDKKHLSTTMELEADRLKGLSPKAEDMLKEREVIIEERRMRVDNVPKALFAEQMASILFVHHPYGTPLIGWQHEMAALTMQDVLDFHTKYYRVNHAVLVLAGDITAAEAKPLVEKYYGDLEAGERLPERAWVSEPPARSEKRFTMRHALVNEPYWERNYLAPSIKSGDTSLAIPLMVFAQALGGGQTSVLYQDLVVKQKVAVNVSAAYSGFSLGPETFTIRATPAQGVSIEKLEQAVDVALKRATAEPLASNDIERAKTLLKAETLYAREGLQGMAYMVGWLKMLGMDANYVNEWPKLISAVTAEQMQQSAKKIFVPEGSATGILLPEVKP
jgi:zinc protease